jgi:hypothetical protein
MAKTANDGENVTYLTLSIGEEIDDARRMATDGTVRLQGGTATWRMHARASRTYALLDLPERHDATAISKASGGIVYERPIVALALFPALPEALPRLREALTGPGRPAGIVSAGSCPGGVVVEWDPSLTAAAVILGLVDVELARFASARTAELLSPLPESIVAKLAAEGLQAPQLGLQRILELRLGHA